jgi:hypothetical protein
MLNLRFPRITKLRGNKGVACTGATTKIWAEVDFWQAKRARRAAVLMLANKSDFHASSTSVAASPPCKPKTPHAG